MNDQKIETYCIIKTSIYSAAKVWEAKAKLELVPDSVPKQVRLFRGFLQIAGKQCEAILTLTPTNQLDAFEKADKEF